MLGSAAAATGAAVSRGAGAAFGKFVGTLGSSPRQADKSSGKNTSQDVKFPTSCDDALCNSATKALQVCFEEGKPAAECSEAGTAQMAMMAGPGFNETVAKIQWGCFMGASANVTAPGNGSTCHDMDDWMMKVTKAGIVNASCTKYHCFQASFLSSIQCSH